MVKEVYYAYSVEDTNKRLREGWTVVDYKVVRAPFLITPSFVPIVPHQTGPQDFIVAIMEKEALSLLVEVEEK